MPFSRSAWMYRSWLLLPGVTRGEGRTRARGHTHGTFSSMLSWLKRRAVSNACLSDSISRLAASPKSLILFTFTNWQEEKTRGRVSTTRPSKHSVTAYETDNSTSNLVQFHPVRNRSTPSACPPQATSRSSSSCLSASAGWDRQDSPLVLHPERLAPKRL